MATVLNVLVGCTAVGKTEASLRLAERLDAEIVSVDSMQVYRRMDIGTAKPTPAERVRAKHHLIDVVEPSESFSVGRFVESADRAIAEIAAAGKSVWAVGGTALYVKALIEGLFEGPPANAAFRAAFRERLADVGHAALHAELVAIDPVAADRIHPNDARRIERALEVHHLTGTPISELQRQWDIGRTRYDCRVFVLTRSREDLSHRINTRVKMMFEAGFLAEVRALLAEPEPLSEQAGQALGYAEVIDHLNGKEDFDKTVELIKVHTRRFAKSQRTWFRGFRDAHTIELTPDATVDDMVERICRHLDP